MPDVIRVIEGKMDELSVFGSDSDTEDATAIRNFIQASDLANSHVAATATGLGAKSDNGVHIIDLGTNNGSSAREIVGTMQDVLGRETRTKAMARRKGGANVCIVDPNNAAQRLG